ncbi:hypothetical protein ACFY4C_41185 [Actinomadura viridis]|uniref:hypothetical protein n=1 Tax=Actinomadura viridis TaxID=58110 RepID=UPI00367A1D81
MATTPSAAAVPATVATRPVPDRTASRRRRTRFQAATASGVICGVTTRGLPVLIVISSTSASRRIRGQRLL